MVYCVYLLESPRWGDSNENKQHTFMLKKILKCPYKAPWSGAIINPHWLELPLSRTNFQGPKGVRAIEVLLYLWLVAQSQGTLILARIPSGARSTLDTSISFHKKLASPLATNFTEDLIKMLSILHIIWIVTYMSTLRVILDKSNYQGSPTEESKVKNKN